MVSASMNDTLLHSVVSKAFCLLTGLAVCASVINSALPLHEYLVHPGPRFFARLDTLAGKKTILGHSRLPGKRPEGIYLMH